MQETQSKEWYDDKNFWRMFGPEIFTQERIEAATDEIDKICRLLDIKPNNRILDLCCGIGRHSLELARRGFDVVGVDLTAEYLDQARKQARAEDLSIEFIEKDMRQYCRIESFDTILNMFTAFGYFEEIEDDKQVLKNAFGSLRSGGKLIIDVMSKEVLARIFQTREWRYMDGRIFLRETRISRNWSWCENKWMILENGTLQEFGFGHRIYSAVELIGLLKSCGFSTVNCYGDLTGADYDHNAKRLIAVAEK